MSASSSAVPDAPKIIPGAKAQSIACELCTFLNTADAKVCAVCEAELKPPAHEAFPNGMWRCGSCSNVNQKGDKACRKCQTPFSLMATSAAPSQIFCTRCSFLNDGDNMQCVQCDNQLRSTLEKFSTDLRDSTNFLARDMGVNINVKCPGCMVVCFVPPATAGLRCGSCHTYFASPSVGDVTNFHMSRLASSISSSFRGFFSRDTRSSTTEQEQEAPIGRLLAIGDIAQQRNAQSSSFGSSSQSGSSSASSLSNSGSASGSVQDEDEEKEGTPNFMQETPAGLSFVDSTPPPPRPPPVETRQQQQQSPRRTYENAEDPPSKHSASQGPVAVAVAAASPASGGRAHAPMALEAADPQDMIRVEGDIVEL